MFERRVDAKLAMGISTTRRLMPYLSPDGRRSFEAAWTCDERIEGGLYSYDTLEGVRDRIENPALLERSAVELEGC